MRPLKGLFTDFTWGVQSQGSKNGKTLKNNTYSLYTVQIFKMSRNIMGALGDKQEIMLAVNLLI